MWGFNSAVIESFAALDKALEDSGILPKFEEIPEVKDITTPDGKVLASVNELRGKLDQLTLSNKAIWERYGEAAAWPWSMQITTRSPTSSLAMIAGRRPATAPVARSRPPWSSTW